MSPRSSDYWIQYAVDLLWWIGFNRAKCSQKLLGDINDFWNRFREGIQIEAGNSSLPEYALAKCLKNRSALTPQKRDELASFTNQILVLWSRGEIPCTLRAISSLDITSAAGDSGAFEYPKTLGEEIDREIEETEREKRSNRD